MIIPAYNNRELLKNNLPSVVDAMNDSGCTYEIIVVDDASSDGTAEFVETTYPNVKLVRLKENKRFPGAANTGVRAGQYEKVLLLNSDIKLKKGFLTPLLEYFNDDRVFAVSNKAMKDENISLTKPSYMEFRYGLFRDVYADGKERSAFSFGASGGHALFDKVRFLELGGFDEIFKPGYFEDADLAYRGWKRGWHLYHEPRSVVYHENMGTHAKVFSPLYLKIISRRNALIFHWKNLTDWDFVLRHLLFLPAYLLIGSMKAPYLIVSFFWAVTKLGRIARARKEERPLIRCKDKEILRRIKESLTCPCR